MMESIELDYRGIKIHAASNLHKSCLKALDSINLRPDIDVLDLGAGEGAFTQRLLDRGYNVTAVELDQTRFNLPVEHHSFDLNDNFSGKFDRQFDLVVAMEIIEHLFNPRHFISNCLALLNPGGFLLLTTPNVESWFSRIRFLRAGRFLWFEEDDYKSYGHITPIFSWQIEQICEELGATLVKMGNTEARFLRQRLGSNLLQTLRNKITYLTFLYPLMQGRREGEVGIYLITRPNSFGLRRS